MSIITRAWRATALATTMMGIALGGSALAADYTLSINTALATSDPLFKGLEEFKQTVEARTNGKVAVRLFPGSQLGKDEDVLEQARYGAGVAVVVDGGRLATYVKEFGVLGGPYLASGYDGIRKVVTSPMFEEWVKKLHDGAGLQVLSFNWWQGERHLLTNKPVAKPADLSGVRMRTPGAPVWMETIRAMGATPAPMGWADVYPALQQGVIDAVEAQHPASYGSRLYEVTKHLTKTGHFNLITGIVGSAKWFDGLPPDIRKTLREAALTAGDTASRGTEASLAQIEKDMAAKGVTVTEVDTKPFREATAGVYAKLGYSDLKTQIDALMAK
ncbi:C4-dicarboxylate TRAP transporter substrate-binding protein [Azospirillum sp.]|uniref:C4-dicarboxylate TRAP transporter substrate-binding protein n=1 Tax=Azospirillum sp. TaxID=34012 RepID=UPI002D29E65C|nr:C4-dicarboxylate TRAP transporter substrate-binding protein [Azospirillum sp.]HYD66823.1 C4-dicarboxylate TRAP transporter substrate-binding protein [Azospirillum sp.]